jgi:xanthine dehydrogenase small subunit
LAVELQVPVPTGQTAYIKYGRKDANTPSIVTVAVHLLRDGGRVVSARIALNGVGPHPIRAANAEALLEGNALTPATIEKVAEAAAQECEPFTDAVASEWYRRKMTAVYVKRALTELLEKEE